MAIKKNSRIFIAGHKGMVGSAIIRKLTKLGYKNLIYLSKNQLDLTNQKKVLNFFSNKKIDQVYIAAAKVGGIYANSTYPGQFIYENTMIQSNIIHSSFLAGVKKLLFLGSSCIYPKFSTQPIKEEELLAGKLEPTNEPYALAKILGIKMCDSYNHQYGKDFDLDYRSIMPCNLYGIGDNYHPTNSHVIPALINRFHQAKTNSAKNVIIWGSGKPKREFLNVDDLAEASIYIMNHNKKKYLRQIKPNSHINVGTGVEISIKKLALIIKKVVKYDGKISFDLSKPDGTPRKVTDCSRINNLGWRPKINLIDGLYEAYDDYKKILKKAK